MKERERERLRGDGKERVNEILTKRKGEGR